MEIINNFIEREKAVKELDTLTTLLELSNDRGLIDSETYNGLSAYEDKLYDAVVKFDKANFKRMG